MLLPPPRPSRLACCNRVVLLPAQLALHLHPGRDRAATETGTGRPIAAQPSRPATQLPHHPAVVQVQALVLGWLTFPSPPNSRRLTLALSLLSCRRLLALMLQLVLADEAEVQATAPHASRGLQPGQATQLAPLVVTATHPIAMRSQRPTAAQALRQAAAASVLQAAPVVCRVPPEQRWAAMLHRELSSRSAPSPRSPRSLQPQAARLTRLSCWAVSCSPRRLRGDWGCCRPSLRPVPSLRRRRLLLLSLHRAAAEAALSQALLAAPLDLLQRLPQQQLEPPVAVSLALQAGLLALLLAPELALALAQAVSLGRLARQAWLRL